MWGMDAINAPKLWARLPSVPNADPQLATARHGVVLDSGVYFSHFDFVSGGSAFSRDLSRTFNADGLVMSDSGIPGNDVADGHGTHVAGILAGGWGAGDDRGIAGVVGAQARLASCRIFSDYSPTSASGGTTLDLIRCLEHATATKAFVVNFSGGDFYPPDRSVELDALRAAVRGFCAAGAGLLVASAGNSGKDLAREPEHPAAFAGQPGTECVVAVTAVAQGGYLPYFSNYGAQVKVAAPGDFVASDWVAAQGALAYFGSQPSLAGTDRAWTSLSGTSMAAPFVSGAALLLGNAFPAATAAQVRACLESASAGRPLADGSGVPLDDPDVTPANAGGFVGGGLLDVDAAYDCVAQRVAGLTTCPSARVVVDLGKGDQGLACGQALPTVPRSAFGAKPDVAYSFDPPGPYVPSYSGGGGAGVYTISAIPEDGSAACTLTLEVKECRLRCAQGDVVVRHKDSGCASAGAPFPTTGAAAADVVTFVPPGVTYAPSPPGPYPPNRRTTVALVPSDGSPSCQVTLDVKPCGLTCNAHVVTIDQSSGGGSCSPSGPGAPFPAAQALLSLDAPSVGYVLTPPGPYTAGPRAVRVTPTTGAPACFVSLVVEPCRLSCAPTATVSLDRAGGGGGCASSVAFPAGAVGAGAGVKYTLKPPGPYTTAGTFDVVATAGADKCTTRLTVERCASAPPPPPASGTITCASSPLEVQLSPSGGGGGGCDAATVPPTELYTSTGGVRATVSPAGPYKPGATTVRVTPARGSPSSAKACSVSVSVAPCVPQCAATPPTVPADAGKCSLAALPRAGLLAPASVGRTATGVVAVVVDGGAPPALPLPVGPGGVSAAVAYPGGVRSAPSPSCPITVADTQPPKAKALAPCLYPESAAGYPPDVAEACLSADQLLASVADNCPGAASASVARCANVSPPADGPGACRVAAGGSSVCVALQRLPSAARTARVVAATVRVTDAQGNAADVVARVSVFRARPAAGANAACLRVSSTGELVGGVRRRPGRRGSIVAVGAAAAAEADGGGAAAR